MKKVYFFYRIKIKYQFYLPEPLYRLPRSRFYTYLWTMTYIMEACDKFGLLLIIADRINPIGGDLFLAEGPFLDEENCSSFIGRWSIPIRHSCTLGELARLFKAKKMPSLQLTILPLTDWKRNETNVNEIFTPTSLQLGSEKLLCYILVWDCLKV